MDKSTAARPHRRHLIESLPAPRPAPRPGGPAAGRLPGHGNGVRVHAIWFAALSLLGLLAVLAAAALATTR